MTPTPFDEAAEAVAQSPAEKAHETGELYRLLIESVRDYAIFALDPRGYILSWNPGAERFKGYKAEEIIGKHFSIFYPKEKIAEHWPEHELEIAARVGRFEDEGWRVRKDGSEFWANVVITALRDESGRLIAFAKVTRDLTARRLAEETLKESEERFRLLVQNVKDYAIFMLDTRGYIQTWNEGAQRFKQYTADEIIGKHFSVFYPPEDVAADKPARELAIATLTGKYEEEGWRVRKDGTYFWTSVVITALRNASGDLVGFGKVTRDLTERRAAELQALENARRVAVEESARQRADVANLAKSQFLAAMSHELRTPLNAIGGYAQLLEMEITGPITPPQREQLDRIVRSQQHLLGIINDILNFSRIEAGQLTYNIGPVKVCDVVDSVAGMIAPQAKAKGLHFEHDGGTEGLTVLADRSKVEQILLNLLSNSVKFTQAGGTVAVTCATDPTAERVTFSVRDTGMGIPADQLSEIFEPFVQVGRNLTNSREGTGLGLAISRDLARGMGGEIVVESIVDEGSRFTVSLPAPTSETHP